VALFSTITFSPGGSLLVYHSHKVKYSVRSGYDGSQYVQWSTDGAKWSDTTIRPLDKQRDLVATYDLKAAGVDTWDKVRNLRIRFSNSTTSTVGFDYVWVAVQ
jgi:hypothetical protein